MAVPVIMPRQGQSVESCIITKWGKQVGDKVYGGEVIGKLSDGSGEMRKDKKFLHLELWHRSKPLDPNIYIAF